MFSGEAHSVHFGPDGSVWATDSVYHTVRKFSPTGELLLTLGKQKVAGDNASQDAFNRPNAVAFGPRGQVFVSDGPGQPARRRVHTGGEVRPDLWRKRRGRATVRWRWFMVWPSMRKAASTPPTATTSAYVVFDAQGTFLKNIAIPGRGGSFMAVDGTFYISDVNSGRSRRAEERPDR